MSKSSSRPGRNQQKRNAPWIVVIVGVLLFGCAGIVAFNTIKTIVDSFMDRGATPAIEAALWEPDSAVLTVAVSPVMAPVLDELASQFNEQQLRAPDGKSLKVTVAPYDPEEMVSLAQSHPPFQAISPDSSLWLDRLEQQWAAGAEGGGQTSDVAMPIAQRRIAAQQRYAVSPIVLAAWEDVARRLGWPDAAVSWQDVQQRATQDPDFKWSHANTKHASGLLAVLAEFYAGAGLTRGLTVEAATDPATLEYVQAVEGTVRFYGENEDQVVARLREEGRGFLDLFVAQERVVIDWNRQNTGDRLIALYPAEGALWTDHPLALLELGQRGGEPAVTANQRRTYQAFAEFLASAAAQQHLLEAGYRPADLSISLDGAGSPFAGDDAVDWRQPQTTLQMPPAEVVDVVRDYWYYTKRPTNVYLVVDTSGSMEGSKLTATKAALKAFLSQIRGDRDRVGIIEFGSGLKDYSLLASLDEPTRTQLDEMIDRMEATGGTALTDAVYAGVATLQQENQADAINAVVVMTDGLENESDRDLYELQALVRQNPALPIVIFTIGFGQDADESTLSEMARIGGGQFRRAGEADIEELYRIISTYF
ncbi:MAG: substrate-binding and VWA domain-containing protein [Caldilinea sp.]|uniref:substrate-binding and VWA domain-containing protein n=1 Tax=Caldilinea sp. TaxID=2293560 RepID=UPI002C85BFD4|nr:substrate-binding and VWA domain-containing protein [Caldilinea sp.]HRA65679.1 substrate-binding and VWA domain-containing protein [Caldilinea sp.]